jgi:DNA polymerase III epsilon subunit-like protein
LARWLDGAVIVGNVPSFDVAFLDVFLRKHGQCLTTHYQPVDVEAMAVGFLHGTVAEAVGRGAKVNMQVPAPPWPSDVLAEELGLTPQPTEDRHTALGDARYVRAMYDAITRPPS